MKTRRDEAIRFAVGDPRNPQSSIWRFWVWRDDVYLGARIWLDLFKVSLHASGVWRVAWVSSLERPDRQSDRVIRRWKRPPEFAPGWTPSVAILVASTAAAEPFDSKAVDDARILWLPFPSSGMKLLFKVLFSTPTASPREPVLAATDSVVGRLSLANGGAVWLVERRDELLENEAALVRDVMAKTKIRLKGGSEPETIAMSARACLITSSDTPHIADQPTILDVPLGRENLEVEGEAGS